MREYQPSMTLYGQDGAAPHHNDAPLPLDGITDTGTRTMMWEAQNDNRVPKESVGLAIVILRGHPWLQV